ncbi:hypothetical protein E2C00_11500 [Streptomyces sp. WAC05374]|uniref:hypothetical protein n=1 Tax=Streptomyces sp. WAC05374 TaxID=2487420 RepID=UPI000F884149|nr:hypothetical protein [Streptomyces sp. WAC05374]RST17253.1 hypothetical protein EF905_10285 [Streptomyces sp. WAC05374]TDF47385.1 hypothetical protein E2B92_10325 [Streptomyces sp. WAC05374]TDF57643.1 hypothetical protein E2C00_11500 [Streptomyces sp. WAC05374]TDF61748.1 hypothetical protein E2C02_02700 [Streptomyces sp. WAC05374]
MSLGDEHDGASAGGGGTGQTRTRLPDSGTGDVYGVYGGARRPARNSRSLITVVGVVVLLIAAIAFANRSGDGDGSSSDAPAGRDAAAPTAATGVKPVAGKNGTIPSGYAHDEQGAQSAAANYAVALGSDGMFNTERRHQIVQSIADASTRDKLQSGFDADYSEAFLTQIGLKADGSAPAGSTFVNRTLPAGTKVKNYAADTADVDVWCTGLFGLTGETSTKPVTSGWFTVTLKLKWNGSDWKVLETSQKTGPTPVTGDNPVSGSDEIAGAVNEYGGFTYAR